MKIMLDEVNEFRVKFVFIKFLQQGQLFHASSEDSDDCPSS